MSVIVAVSSSRSHHFSKPNQLSIRLIAGLGVEGDAHAGKTVQHLSRVRRDPTSPNLRQVHLIHAELHDELNAARFKIAPGDMGENVTTRGVNLLNLPTGARLHLGGSAIVEITGLRNPCTQLDDFQPGLMQACLGRGPNNEPIRKAGVMSIVLVGGEVHVGDAIRVELPVGPHRPLAPV